MLHFPQLPLFSIGFQFNCSQTRPHSFELYQNAAFDPNYKRYLLLFQQPKGFYRRKATVCREDYPPPANLLLDALHCNPTTLEMLAEEGKYMVGLKENQKELKRVLSEEIARSEPIYRTTQESEKQSGRLETRQYEVYAAEKVEKAKRGKKSGIKIAIKVERESIEPGTGKRSVETSLSLSNESEKLPEVCHAIRKHWQVEVTNNLRDTTLAEDKLCVKETTVNRVMAGVRTLALGLLRLTNGANKKAQLDKFADNFGYLVCWLKSIHFL